MTTNVQNGTKQLTVLTGKDATNILRLAESAHLPSQFDNILAQIEKLLGAPVEWKLLGGGDTVAHSTIGASGESTHLLTEPIINFFDAALEMQYQLACLKGDGYQPQSIAEAVNRWFGVPEGGLPAWDVRSGDNLKAFQELARLSQLIVKPGSGKSTPTVTFLDRFIGQHPVHHEDTILSIHKGLKANTPFLAGQYGHGAAFTFGFSNGGQILISRRHPDLLETGYDDLVGLSLVRRRKPSETGGVNTTYWYAVSPETGTPLAFLPESLGDPRWHGLRRTCIDYEMLKSTERDIYFSLDYNIDNPAMPYTLDDQRPDSAGQVRFMRGIAKRLHDAHEGRRNRAGKNEVRVPYRRTSVIDLDAFVGDGQSYGSIEMTVSFVKQEGTGKGNELFTGKKDAELWTLHGQRHHSRTRMHFGKAHIGLDAIRDNLVVEVKLDKLSPDAKGDLLTTDRQGAAERAIRTHVEAAIDKQLADDTTLEDLNRAAIEEALSKAAGSNYADLEKELVQFGHMVTRKKKVRVKKQTTGKGKSKPRPNVPPPAPISPLHPHPTFLRFRKNFRDVVHVQPGQTGSVLLEADAVDGYFNATVQPSYQFTPPMGSTLTIYATEELQDGRMRVRIKAAQGAALGKAQLTASYLPPNANGPLTTTIDVEIVAPKPKAPGGGTKQPKTTWEYEEQEVQAPPEARVVYEDITPTWAEVGLNDWTTETVAEYKGGIVWINGDYENLADMLQEAGKSLAEDYLKLYMAPVVMTAVSIARQEANPPKTETGDDIELAPQYRAAAFEAAALGALFTIRKLKNLKLGGSEEDEG